MELSSQPEATPRRRTRAAQVTFVFSKEDDLTKWSAGLELPESGIDLVPSSSIQLYREYQALPPSREKEELQAQLPQITPAPVVLVLAGAQCGRSAVMAPDVLMFSAAAAFVVFECQRWPLCSPYAGDAARHICGGQCPALYMGTPQSAREWSRWRSMLRELKNLAERLERVEPPEELV